MSRSRLFFVLLGAASATLMGAGCGGGANTPATSADAYPTPAAMAPAAPGTAPAPSGSAGSQAQAMLGPVQGQTLTGSQIPADFPKDVLQYPGAKILMETWASHFGDATAVEQTPDSADQVRTTLVNAYQNLGFQADGARMLHGVALPHYKKGTVEIELEIKPSKTLTTIIISRSIVKP